jgi:hypothetical protein
MGAGWRLWRLSWLIAWLFWWYVVASPAWVMVALAPCTLTFMSVCNISFVELLLFFFGGFWGMCCDVNSCNVFLLLFMVLCVPIPATLCMRAVLTQWHAFLFLRLKFFPHLFFLLLGGLRCFIFLYEFLCTFSTGMGLVILPGTGT